MFYVSFCFHPFRPEIIDVTEGWKTHYDTAGREHSSWMLSDKELVQFQRDVENGYVMRLSDDIQDLLTETAVKCIEYPEWAERVAALFREK